MIDIETLGREPGCAVLSIGAASFDLKKNGIEQQFYVSIDPQSNLDLGLIQEHETLEWWEKQDSEVREEAFGGTTPLRDALIELSGWCKGVSHNVKPWCQAASFDAPILNHAYQKTCLETPWNFWNVRDTRTLYDLAKFDPYSSMTRAGNHHNALDDAIHQVLCVQEAYKRLKKWF